MMLRKAGQATVLLLGSASLLPVTAPVASAAQENAPAFVAPTEALLLTRELRRSLADGKQIVARRSYEVRFTREGSGWRLDGRLVDSAIEAPAVLAPLAALEKARTDDGLFPIYLDSQGMIVTQHGSRDGAALGTAHNVATALVKDAGIPGADKAAALGMMQRIATQAQTTGGTWPADLFRPVTGHRSEVRTMDVPGAGEGRITVTIDSTKGSGGLLEHMQRAVVTELGSSRRESLELFHLSALR